MRWEKADRNRPAPGAGRRGDEGVDALALACGKPTTAASATLSRSTGALSISAVPMRWPETSITSSIRSVFPAFRPVCP
jgi:hypothetical protein